MDIVIIIPTYNEVENIEVLVEKILALKLHNSKIIIVDDNSPDGTGKLADSLAKRHQGKITVIHRPGKLGLGTAHTDGFKIAASYVAKVIITMDADLSHEPSVIPQMLNKLKSSDLVIGSRYVEGGGIVGFPLWRLALSSIAQALCRFLLRIKVHDSTSAYRAYKKDALKKIRPETIKSDGYSYLIEVVYRAQKERLRVFEIPIIFKAREKGKSKVSQAEIAKALATVFRLKFFQ